QAFHRGLSSSPKMASGPNMVKQQSSRFDAARSFCNGALAVGFNFTTGRPQMRSRILALTMAMLAAFAGSAHAAGNVTVFAAASLTNAMQDIASAYEAKTRVDIVSSFASSSTLARQIENGAPAEDVRAALLYVDRGEAPLGIVYLTDARSAAK